MCELAAAAAASAAAAAAAAVAVAGFISNVGIAASVAMPAAADPDRPVAESDTTSWSDFTCSCHCFCTKGA